MFDIIQRASDFGIWCGVVSIFIAYWTFAFITVAGFWHKIGKLLRVVFVIGFVSMAYTWFFTIFPVVHAYLEMR